MAVRARPFLAAAVAATALLGLASEAAARAPKTPDALCMDWLRDRLRKDRTEVASKPVTPFEREMKACEEGKGALADVVAQLAKYIEDVGLREAERGRATEVFVTRFNVEATRLDVATLGKERKKAVRGLTHLMVDPDRVGQDLIWRITEGLFGRAKPPNGNFVPGSSPSDRRRAKKAWDKFLED